MSCTTKRGETASRSRCHNDGETTKSTSKIASYNGSAAIRPSLSKRNTTRLQTSDATRATSAPKRSRNTNAEHNTMKTFETRLPICVLTPRVKIDQTSLSSYTLIKMLRCTAEQSKSWAVQSTCRIVANGSTQPPPMPEQPSTKSKSNQTQTRPIETHCKSTQCNI